MTENAACKICGNQAEHIPDRWFPEWRCPRCGRFDYDRSNGWQPITSPAEMVRLSGWVREQNAAGSAPVRITREHAARVMQRRLPRLRERANQALCVIARKYPDQDQLTMFGIMASDLELQGVSYCENKSQAKRLIEILVADGYLRRIVTDDADGHLPEEGYLTAAGMLAAEDLSATGSGSQGFVAMWFDDSMNEAWLSGFEPGIRAAGFRARRIDQKDYVGGISDEIMAEIRQSRFVVADYTGQRNGVYFEVGFAVGLGLTVIPTCHAAEMGKLHFDIRHLNTLEWNTPADLADKLNNRIRAVVGVGPNADHS